MKISFTISDDYTGDLRKRMKEYGISQGALSRELGLQESQVSRWFNKPMQPRVENIIKIEGAIAKIRARMAKDSKKASGGTK